MRGYEWIGCLLGKRFVGAWSLEKRAGRYGTVLYLLRTGPQTNSLTASQRGGNTKQKQRRKRAKTGGTIMETGRYVAVYSIDFTAFPCFWRKDRQYREVRQVTDLQRAIRGSQKCSTYS
jgi:hypothetical protein